MRWLVLLVSARPPFLLLLFKLSPSLSLLYLCFFYTYIYISKILSFTFFNFQFSFWGHPSWWQRPLTEIVSLHDANVVGDILSTWQTSYNWHSKLIRGWFCHCGYSAFPLIGTRARVALQRSKSVTVVPQRGPNPSPLQFLFLTLHPFGAFLRLSGLTQKQGSEWFWLLRACTWHTHLPSFHSLQDSSQVLFSTVVFFHAFRDEFSSILFPSS